MKPVLLIAALMMSSACGAAWAQDSAADIIRKGMAKRGAYDGYTVKENSRGAERLLDDEPWYGLTISEAFAYPEREKGWSYVVVVQNFSSVDYCIRPRFAAMPRGRLYYAQSGNQIVKAGQSLTIFTAADETLIGTIKPVEEIAFWRPDYTKENGSYCRAVAPRGLDDWLRQPSDGRNIDFAGSRR
ncbi:MAG: hypothetical protein KF842_07120 [Caulobacter sp.]|nr:hypothetical protein [Caulobacter sp.]